MPDLELAALSRSLAEFGFVQPVVARRSDRLVIGGHQRIQAARQLGWTHVPVAWWEGSDRAARALNLALNRIHGDWDEAKLATTLAELADVSSLSEALNGFDTAWTSLAGFDVKEILAALDGHLGETTRREDLTALARQIVPTVQRSARAQPGDLFALGPHRLLCGDARVSEAVRSLCDGAAPSLLFTDPPYNVGYSAEATPGRAAASGRSGGRRQRPLGPIAGDDLGEEGYAALISEALTNAASVLPPGAPVYVCGGTTTTTVYDAAFAAAGFVKSSIIVWDKGEFSFGRRDYQSQYELLYYGWRRGRRHPFFGGRSQSDIWTIPRDPSAAYIHPTQKPTALAARALRNSSRAGEIVLDLFGGSGSTLIAAEETGRRAFLLELDPHYVDVIVARWEAFSGGEAYPLGRRSVA